MRIQLLLAAALVLAHASAALAGENPLYTAPVGGQTNQLGGAEAKKLPGDGHGSDASAGKGQDKTVNPAGPVKWSAPELDSQKNGKISGTQSNPLYQESGNQGDNPLFEAKGEALREAPGQDSASAAAPAEGAVKNSPLYQGDGPRGANPLAERPGGGGTVSPLYDAQGDERSAPKKDGDAVEGAKTDAARERAAQDAREAARPPITPSVMPPPMVDFPKGGMR